MYLLCTFERCLIIVMANVAEISKKSPGFLDMCKIL